MIGKPRLGLRPYLRSLAGWVWNRQDEAKKHGLSLQEETITEMLLLRVAKDWSRSGLQVKMFTRAQEKQNGADWEWFVIGPNCSVNYRIQAKRLYHSGKHAGHYGGHDPSGRQGTVLISKAGPATPLYLFYNHSSSSAFSAKSRIGFRGPSFWGCAFAEAGEVISRSSTDPAKLITCMHPWHELFDSCISSTCGSITTKTQADKGIDGRDKARGTHIRDGRPEWVEFLQDAEFIEKYLVTKDLLGVALIDASHADFDWIAE